MLTKSFKITLDSGLYAKPATELITCAMDFSCEILLEAFKKVIDFKSIMGVLSLGICGGTTICIKTNGIDEFEAMQTITKKIYELGLGTEA